MVIRKILFCCQLWLISASEAHNEHNFAKQRILIDKILSQQNCLKNTFVEHMFRYHDNGKLASSSIRHGTLTIDKENNTVDIDYDNGNKIIYRNKIIEFYDAELENTTQYNEKHFPFIKFLVQKAIPDSWKILDYKYQQNNHEYFYGIKKYSIHIITNDNRIKFFSFKNKNFMIKVTIME